MTISTGTRKLSVGAIVAACGGVVAAVGAFLAWETMDAGLAAALGESSTISGWSSGGTGKIEAVLAIAAVALAVAWLVGTKLPIPSVGAGAFAITSPPGLVVVVGALALVDAVWGFVGVSQDVSNANAEIPGFGAIGFGVFVSLAGAAVVLVGGLLGTIKKAE